MITNLITGTGRSGTTFLAHVFYNAGLDMGNITPEHIGKNGCPQGGGMEHGEFAKLNAQIMRDIHGHSVSETVELHRSAMNADWPTYIKDPRYCITWPVWESAGIRPKHVFLCVRDPIATKESVHKSTDWNMTDVNALFRFFYECLVYLEEHDIPHTLVHYPRIGKDKDYAEWVLGPYIQNPWDVVQKTWSDQLHHFKSAAMPATLK